MGIWKNAPRSDRRLFALSVGVLGVSKNRATANSADEEFYRFMDVAAEIYVNIRNKYVEEVEPKQVLEAALRGMTSVLDEHTVYMPPVALEDLEKDTGKEYGGIGIHITLRQNILTVMMPMPGSPAARAGIQPWDRIIEIEGESTEGFTTRDAVDRLTGPPNTKVKFKVWRPGVDEPIDVELTRESIRIDSVHHKMLEDQVGYVRLSKFAENSTADIRKALTDLRGQGMQALILDLRFNTGGLLREAIEISELFVPKNELIVSTKGRNRNQNREYTSSKDPIVNVPVFVLVNGGSASASEILAGALQDHHVATIIGPAGRKTFGKGSVQTIENLSTSLEEDKEGNARTSALKLTTARYYTPSGRTIHQIGITPDIGIPIPAEHESHLLEHGLLGDPPSPARLEAEGETPVLQEGQPFYEAAQTPRFREDNFTDIMLNESLEMMKQYLEMLPSLDPAERRPIFATSGERADAAK